MDKGKKQTCKLVLLCMITVLALAGCKAGGKDQNTGIVLDLEEAAYQIAEAAEFETTYNADAAFFEKSYGMTGAEVAGFKALFGTMLDANRLALFEVKDAGQKKAAYAAAEAIKKQLQGSFGKELEALKKVADGAVIVEKENYVLFLSGTQVEKGVEAFENMFQPQDQ